VVHYIPQLPKTGITQLHIFPQLPTSFFEESPVKSRDLIYFSSFKKEGKDTKS
jgi:hypothetical protein